MAFQGSSGNGETLLDSSSLNSADVSRERLVQIVTFMDSD